MQTLEWMPKGVWTEMFKAPALHANENPLVSRLIQTHTSTHSHSVHKHLATDSVPANYKRSNQFHHGPRPGKSTSMTPATWPMSLYLTVTYIQAETEPAGFLLLSTARRSNTKRILAV